MAISHMSRIIHQLRQAALAQAGVNLTDGQLLESFVSRKDREALEALVQRHGPMVWGVCRRLLPHHDAEDAFQATFLVLVRKAASVLPRAMVGNWLYGVAHQAALNARTRIIRQRAREVQVTVMPEPAVMNQDLRRDLQSVLDQELTRLPDRYRAVIVSCDMEGKTRKEAARQLGLAEGTVASRLARARTLLAKRLARHGVVLSGGAFATMLSQNAAASVPASVFASTMNAVGRSVVGKAATAGAISVKVAALTEGVLKTMFRTKLKGVMAVLFLAIGMAALGGGLLRHETAAARQIESRGEDRKPENPTTVASRKSPCEAAATSSRQAASIQAADYKTLFVRTLGVMAEHFEAIDYANQYDGRIEARTHVPSEQLGVIRLGTVNIRTSDTGGFTIEIRINKIKDVGEKEVVVGRDTELELVILQRLKTLRGTQKRGTAEKVQPEGSTGRIQVGDRLYIRALNTLPGNPINGGFRVEPSGKVPLGPFYGRVQVSGLTPEEAEAKIKDHLAHLIGDPEVSLTWYDPVVHGTRQAPEKQPRVGEQ
jgi:RNA polymerase sigma factor (sigma-70 family)